MSGKQVFLTIFTVATVILWIVWGNIDLKTAHSTPPEPPGSSINLFK